MQQSSEDRKIWVDRCGDKRCRICSRKGAFEACEMAEIERQFATNVFGLMEVTRAILPHFRLRQ